MNCFNKVNPSNRNTQISQMRIIKNLTNKALKPHLRQSAANSLLRMGKSGIDILIGLVDGKNIFGLKPITLKDQLFAINALGNSKNKFVLNYLEHIYHPKSCQYFLKSNIHTINEDNEALESTFHLFELIEFPNAKGRLKESLKVSIELDWGTIHYLAELIKTEKWFSASEYNEFLSCDIKIFLRKVLGENSRISPINVQTSSAHHAMRKAICNLREYFKYHLKYSHNIYAGTHNNHS